MRRDERSEFDALLGTIAFGKGGHPRVATLTHRGDVVRIKVFRRLETLEGDQLCQAGRASHEQLVGERGLLNEVGIADQIT